MKITYDTIIEYLCSNNQNYTFLTKPNIIKFIDSDTNYIFHNKFDGFFRMGTLVYNKNDINISLFSSILFLMNKNFIYMDENEKIKNINKIINDMRNYWNTKYKKNKYFNKNDGEKLIINYKLNKLLEENFDNFLEMICFCFKINIIRLNYKKNNISLHYFKKFNDGSVNLFIPTIILGNYNNFWEPIYNNNSKIFNLKNKSLQFILKKIKIKSIKEILEESGLKSKNISVTFISKKEIIPTLQKSKLNKMRKNDLLNLASSLNISINQKNTKNIIINKILSL